MNLLISLYEPSKEQALFTWHITTEACSNFGTAQNTINGLVKQNVCDALTFLLENIFTRFGTKLYRQVVRIPMGTNCAPLVANLF